MIRVAVVQTDPVFGKKKQNIEQCLDLMNSVSADLYVLPELFATGYNFIETSEVQELAEPMGTGETYVSMRKFVSDRNCFVVYGFAEKRDEACCNSAALLGHDGTSELYRKIHLFDREKLFFESGDLGFRVFETAIGRIGVMICFDWYFPESARTLALRGAQIVAHPSNLVLPNCPGCMPTRSLENRVFTATANRIGEENRGGHHMRFIGLSQVTSARGVILHRCSAETAEVGVCEIDLTLSDDKNLTARNHLFNDRRTEFYQ